MKRTELKRGTSILKSKTPLKAKSPMKKGTKKMNKVGKELISKWRLKADKAIGKLVRSIGFCQAHGLDQIQCKGVLQWAHIVTRSNYRLRHEPLNALCLCQAHHYFYTLHPWDWREFIEAHFPEQFEFVQTHKNEVLKTSVDYYKEIVGHIEESVNDGA